MNEISITANRSVVFCARIYDHNTGAILKPTEIEAISYTANKIVLKLQRITYLPVTGHTNISVPIIPTALESPIQDEYWHSDDIGYSFIHEPDIRTNPLFVELGTYEVVYTIRPITGNPVVIPFRVSVESI